MPLSATSSATRSRSSGATAWSRSRGLAEFIAWLVDEEERAEAEGAARGAGRAPSSAARALELKAQPVRLADGEHPAHPRASALVSGVGQREDLIRHNPTVGAVLPSTSSTASSSMRGAACQGAEHRAAGGDPARTSAPPRHDLYWRLLAGTGLRDRGPGVAVGRPGHRGRGRSAKPHGARAAGRQGPPVAAPRTLQDAQKQVRASGGPDRRGSGRRAFETPTRAPSTPGSATWCSAPATASGWTAAPGRSSRPQRRWARPRRHFHTLRHTYATAAVRRRSQREAGAAPSSPLASIARSRATSTCSTTTWGGAAATSSDHRQVPAGVSAAPTRTHR